MCSAIFQRVNWNLPTISSHTVSMMLLAERATSEGSSGINRVLSEKRAARVKQLMIEQGVSPEKIAGIVDMGDKSASCVLWHEAQIQKYCAAPTLPSSTKPYCHHKFPIISVSRYDLGKGGSFETYVQTHCTR